MWRRSKEYLRKNWGAPFVVAFIILLIASAGLLSEGKSSTANSVAVYAFYALVLGVVLQIASYIKYGEGREEEETEQYVPARAAPYASWRPGRRTIAVIVVVILIIAIAATTYYYKPSITSHTTHTTQTTIGPLSAGVNFIETTPGPDNSVQITVGINETGGLSPYNFTAYWSDGVNQSNSVGVFIRIFLENQTIPSSIKVIVSGADRQTATVEVTIPFVSRTTTTVSTSSTTTTSITSPVINFVESGLPSGVSWSVTLGNYTQSSSDNQIVFIVPPGTYSYTVSESYNSNFSRIYTPNPKTGSINLGRTSIEQTISYTPVIVGTPEDQLFVLTGKQITALSNGSEQFNLTYANLFPVQIQANAVVLIQSNSTGLIVSERSSTISPMGDSQVSTIILVNNLLPGSYVATLYVETFSGTILSQMVSLIVTVT